jgi:ADP-glucose pyrophosphorylase
LVDMDLLSNPITVFLIIHSPIRSSNMHISPTLFTKNNNVIQALDAAGASRIVTVVTQVSHRYFSKLR